MSPRVLVNWPSGVPLAVAGTPVTSASVDNTGSVVASLPTGIVSGEVLLAAFRLVGDRTVTTPTGWALVTEPDATMKTNGALFIFARDADGAEGATVTFTLSAGATWVAHAFRFEGAFGVTGGVEATLAYDDTAEPNPPSITPAWGSAEDIVLAFGSTRRTDHDFTAPTSYADLLNVVANADASASTGDTRLVSARRTLTMATEDPGNFAKTGAGTINRAQAATVAIRPAA